jgi:hypothetical protein
VKIFCRFLDETWGQSEKHNHREGILVTNKNTGIAFVHYLLEDCVSKSTAQRLMLAVCHDALPLFCVIVVTAWSLAILFFHLFLSPSDVR